MYGFYKLRRNRLLTGTLAGLADKFKWDVWLVRAIFLAIVLLTKIAWLAMILY
ncbi:PspC domain-containing protein, partial [Streptococcus pyogenes]